MNSSLIRPVDSGNSSGPPAVRKRGYGLCLRVRDCAQIICASLGVHPSFRGRGSGAAIYNKPADNDPGEDVQNSAPRETGGAFCDAEERHVVPWKAGQLLHDIGRAFGKAHSSIRSLVSHHGGFVPAVRRRSLVALTLTEREEISRGIASGSSIRETAAGLERAVSTVSREVARHGRHLYRANEPER